MRAYYHPEQIRHHPQTYYSRGKMRVPQEIPARVENLLQAVQELGIEIVTPHDHGIDPLAAVHDREYLEFLKQAHSLWVQMPEDWGQEVMSNIFVREPNSMRGILAQAGRYLADGSCPIGPHTWSSAYWSAQAAVAGARAIMNGDHAAYALSRPPGHHARRDAAGGFCYLNNSAIAAQEMRKKFERIAILDTDMHHGQGIQEIFYDRDDILYVSIHGDPTNFYPAVAGFEDERGFGAGEGFNLNLPMPHGSHEDIFFSRLSQATEAIRDFKADSLILSFGFDIYEKDPQSQVAVTTQGFSRLGSAIRALGLPSLIIQEGGYHLDSLRENANAFFGDLESWRKPRLDMTAR